MDEIKEVEYKLDYTQVYNEYKALFELKIESFIESQGTFYDLCTYYKVSICTCDSLD